MMKLKLCDRTNCFWLNWRVTVCVFSLCIVSNTLPHSLSHTRARSLCTYSRCLSFIDSTVSCFHWEQLLHHSNDSSTDLVKTVVKIFTKNLAVGIDLYCCFVFSRSLLLFLLDLYGCFYLTCIKIFTTVCLYWSLLLSLSDLTIDFTSKDSSKDSSKDLGVPTRWCIRGA